MRLDWRTLASSSPIVLRCISCAGGWTLSRSQKKVHEDSGSLELEHEHKHEEPGRPQPIV